MIPKIIELEQAPVVLVELPENEISFYNIDPSIRGDLESRGFKYHGRIFHLTEDQFAECVAKSAHTGLFGHYVKGIKPLNAYCHEKASESFDTLLNSENVYTENPYEFPTTTDHKYYDEPYDGTGFYQELYSNDMVQWQEAQSRTIDPTKTIVLIRKEVQK